MNIGDLAIVHPDYQKSKKLVYASEFFDRTNILKSLADLTVGNLTNDEVVLILDIQYDQNLLRYALINFSCGIGWIATYKLSKIFYGNRNTDNDTR